MSGIDEQDVTLCRCGESLFWVIMGRSGTMAYLNPDNWIAHHKVDSINKFYSDSNISVDAFIDKIVSFVCEKCQQSIERDSDMFEELLSDVRKRCDVKYVRNRRAK